MSCWLLLPADVRTVRACLVQLCLLPDSSVLEVLEEADESGFAQAGTNERKGSLQAAAVCHAAFLRHQPPAQPSAPRSGQAFGSRQCLLPWAFVSQLVVARRCDQGSCEVCLLRTGGQERQGPERLCFEMSHEALGCVLSRSSRKSSLSRSSSDFSPQGIVIRRRLVDMAELQGHPQVLASAHGFCILLERICMSR